MSPDHAAAAIAELNGRGLSLASAESLTGGSVGSMLTSVPGASAVYVGGVVAYATRIKVEQLGVPMEIVYGDGVVSAACARAMAAGVRTAFGADVGVSTTGVAGPDRQEGKAVGTVFVAVADARGDAVRSLHLTGDREAIRSASAEAALELLATRISAIR